jgi:DNA-binding transcriptional regulator LsrR (DeoR family)
MYKKSSLSPLFFILYFIIKALKDGHTQSSIAKHLQLSSSKICGVIKNESEDRILGLL